jgi:hypothetical protein
MLDFIKVVGGIVIGASAMFFIQPKSDFEVFMRAMEKPLSVECRGNQACIDEEQQENATWYVRQTNKKRCP